MALPWGEPLTIDDVDALPDDGHRYELVDGMLLVTPSPVPDHQGCVTRLGAILDSAAPSSLRAFVAPLDWVVDRFTKFQPDVIVTRREDVGAKRLERTPLIVVEVLSPSTQLADRSLKRLAYERAGVPEYWIVDPKAPSLTVLRLDGARYVEVATVTGDEPYSSDVPFPVTVVPADLVR